MELGEYPRIPAISSTDVRDFYDKQGFSGIIHFTDVQKTFRNGSVDSSAPENLVGALAADGTQHTVPNIIEVARAADQSGLFKISLSGDAHYPVEREIAAENGEFHPPIAFPWHGAKGESGAVGDELIAELEAVFPPSRQVLIPNKEQVEVAPGKRALRQVPFDLDSITSETAHRESVLRFEKNGVGAYSVFSNPRYKEYLERIDPHKILPHFHLGWCTDFCVDAAVEEELRLGYNAIVLVDAVAGVFPSLTGMKLRQMRELGARFMTTQEYLSLVHDWSERKSNWAQVLNDLTHWEKISPTQAWLAKELENPRYADPGPDGPGAPGCAVFLRPATERAVSQ